MVSVDVSRAGDDAIVRQVSSAVRRCVNIVVDMDAPR
jgi:hypothetical protein